MVRGKPGYLIRGLKLYQSRRGLRAEPDRVPVQFPSSYTSLVCGDCFVSGLFRTSGRPSRQHQEVRTNHVTHLKWLERAGMLAGVLALALAFAVPTVASASAGSEAATWLGNSSSRNRRATPPTAKSSPGAGRQSRRRSDARRD